MGKIYYVMGKSASGKDTIYKRLVKELPELGTVRMYTTRPIRDGETNGVEYIFTDEKQLQAMKDAGKVIECRTYDTIYAKHAERIKKVIRLSGAYSALIGLVGLIIMEMLPIQLISAFAPSEEMFLLGVTALRILGLSFVFGGISVMTCYALQGFSRGIASLLISALRQVIILLPLASIMGKMMGINGIWWSFLISETVTVVFAIIYLGIAEKKELSFLASMPLEQSIAE